MTENTFRNEKIIELAGNKILLRPTFENISAMENDIGGIAYLAFKYGKGVDLETKTVDQLLSAKALPPLSEAAKIIFYNQAEKKFSQEEIFNLCLEEGIRAAGAVVLFILKITSGNKFAKDPSPREKKNIKQKNLVETA